MKLCFATNNRHKIDEVAQAVGNTFEIVSLADVGVSEELPETRDTFRGNALQKAEFVYNKTGVACFADDSGLEVEALNGAPGVYSARYAGPQKKDSDNIQLLLSRMQGVDNRKARFRTVVALLGLGEPRFFDGSIDGVIIDAPRGSSGFGYDPVFKPAGYNETFAEMPLLMKNKISHRAQAVAKLIDFLRKHPNH